MNRLILLSTRYHWVVLLFVAIITVLATMQLGRLQLNVNLESMVLEESDAAEFYRSAVDTFGSETPTILFVSDDELYQPRKLERLREAAERLEELPFVDHTDSLFSINRIKNIDDNISLSPYLSNIPENDQETRELLNVASANPFIRNNLLSSTTDSMAVNIFLKSAMDPPQSDEHIFAAIETIARDLDGDLDTVFQIGPSFIRNAISEKITADQATVVPASILILLVTLGLTLKRLTGIIIPLVTAGLSIVWTLGLMAALDIPINVMTSIVPALLIIIGSTEDVHLLSEYLAGRSEGQSKNEAIVRMADKMGVAIGLTIATTYFGFLSIALNDLEILQQFGLVASSGLLINFLITVTMVPVCLRLFGGRAGDTESGPSERTTFARRATALLSEKTRIHRKATVFTCLVVAGVAGYGATSLHVDNNSLNYFEAHSPVLANMQTLQDNLSGMQTLSIVADSRIEGTFLKLRYLEELEKLQEFLLESGIADSAFGFTDYLKVVNAAMEGEEGEELYLPESDGLVSEYMLLTGHRNVAGFVTDDYGKSRIVVRHHIESSRELNEAVERIYDFVEAEMDPGLYIRVTGQSVLTAMASDYLADAQARSLGLMIVVILVILSVLFVDLKAGIIAIVPNIFPIVVLFGVMGFLEIPLDTSTAMTAAIAIGICVDDTMHFMIRYQQNSKSESDEPTVLARTIEEESTPIVSTSVALALGFGTLALSSFPPITHFGLLSSFVMLLALLATFVITPLMLTFTRLITVWEILAVQLKSRLLTRCRLFANMSRWQIKKTILLSRIRSYKAGERIIEFGTTSDEFYVVLEGETEARTPRRESGAKSLRRIGEGEVFGEIALIAASPRTADVVALTDTKVLVMTWERVELVAKLYPRIASKLFRNLSTILAMKVA